MCFVSRFVIAILILLFVVPSASAQLTLIAQADFSADVVGELPDRTLPGGPAGDSLYLTGIGNPSTYTAEQDISPMTGKFLRAVRASGAGSFNFGLKVPAEKGPVTQLVVRFDIAAVPPLSSFNVFSVLRAPNLGVLGSMRINALGVVFSTALFGPGNELQLGGWIEGASNHVEWIIDRATGVQSVALNGILEVDQMQTEYITPGVDFIGMYFEGIGQSQMDVAVDNLEVFEGTTSPTPINSSSFGKIKSTF